MTTTSEANNKTCHVSLAEMGPDDVIVTWLLQRFKEIPKESFTDIVSLLELFTRHETSSDERDEIYVTIREILFPQLIGKVVIESPNSEHVPNQVSKRTLWIGKTVMDYRKRKGWNQAEFAKRCGLRQPQISRLEAGVHSPSHKTLEKIAKALNITIGEIDPSY